MQQSQICVFVCVTISQWVALPGHTSQVGQHVVKLSVRDLSKRREFWEHNDGAAIISSTAWKIEKKRNIDTYIGIM